MNKTMLIVSVALMLMISVVSAVEIDCGSNSWYDWDAGDCVASELQPAFNEITSDINDLQSKDVKLNKKINVNKKDINGLEETISLNANAWSTDRSGTSMRNVVKYVTGEFTDWLKNTFALKSVVEAQAEELYVLEAKIELLSKDLPLTQSNINNVVKLLKSNDGIDVSGCANGLCVSVN